MSSATVFNFSRPPHQPLEVVEQSPASNSSASLDSHPSPASGPASTTRSNSTQPSSRASSTKSSAGSSPGGPTPREVSPGGIDPVVMANFIPTALNSPMANRRRSIYGTYLEVPPPCKVQVSTGGQDYGCALHDGSGIVVLSENMATTSGSLAPPEASRAQAPRKKSKSSIVSAIEIMLGSDDTNASNHSKSNAKQSDPSAANPSPHSTVRATRRVMVQRRLSQSIDTDLCSSKAATSTITGSASPLPVSAPPQLGGAGVMSNPQNGILNNARRVELGQNDQKGGPAMNRWLAASGNAPVAVAAAVVAAGAPAPANWWSKLSIFSKIGLVALVAAFIAAIVLIIIFA